MRASDIGGVGGPAATPAPGRARHRSDTCSRCCLRRRRRMSDLKRLLQGILAVQTIELEMWRALL
jgi:hypothetical protein